MSEIDLLGLLGLAARGGNLVYGQTRCQTGIRSGSIFLLVVDGSVSDNTRKAFTDSCKAHRVPYILLREPNILGAGIGTANKLVGITDEALARSAIEKYELESGGDKA